MFGCEDDSNTDTATDNELLLEHLSNHEMTDSELIACILRTKPDLTIATIPSVDKLYCNESIYSMAGIELFTGLNELRLINTHISSLNVSGLPNLTSLEVFDDDAMSDIITAKSNNIDYVRLDGLPLTRFELFKFPSIKQLALSNLNLEYLNLAVNSTIRDIFISNTVVSDIDWRAGSYTSIRRIDFFESTITSLTLADFLAVDSFSATKSTIDTLELFGNQFVRLMDFSSSSINSVLIRNNRHIGLIFLTDNNIESIDLDTNSSIDGIHLTGNPLLPETITYLDGLTTLDVSY